MAGRESTSGRPAVAERRRRYPAEEARQRILDAALRRLKADGPEALRLQEIAADLGISHPAILHHFGSREGLLGELATHSARDLNEQLSARLRAAGPLDLRDLLALAREGLAEEGQAQLLAWLARTGHMAGDAPRLLEELVSVAHARRTEVHAQEGLPEPEPRDTAHTVLLLALALFGDALVGDGLRASAGLTGPQASEDFQAWLAQLLESHLARSA